MKHSIRTPLSAAALALVLAACGSGGNGDGAATEKAASANPGTQLADQAGNASATPKAEATDANTAANAPLVAADGVSGEVFLGMLEQMPCGQDWVDPAPGPDGSNLSDGLKLMNAHTSMGNYKMDPNYPVVGFSNAMGCNGKSYVPIEAGKHTYTIDNSQFAKAYRLERPLHSLQVQIPVTITDSTVTLGKDIKTDTLLLGGTSTPEESLPPEWKTYQAPTLHADSDFSVDRKGKVPYGTLKEWTEANPADPSKPQFEKLMLQKGDTDNQVKLCWNTDLTYVKRLQCITWEVPTGWQPRTLLTVVEQTLVEDRSVYPNETGFAYWN